MNVDIHGKDVSASERESLKGLLGQWAHRHVEPLLSRTGYNDARLAATLTRRRHGVGKYSVKLRMHLPRKKILVATADADAPEPALSHAESRLQREIEEHLQRLRHQADYKRKARRQRLRELKRRIAELPAATIEQGTAAIEPLLPRVERVVRCELAFLRSSGDLPGDYPTVQDVIDEAIAAVKAEWRADETEGGLLQRLLRESFKVLEREVAASRQYGELLSLDVAPEADAEDQAEAMVQEEIYEYYQPDESLRLSDVLPDESSVTPEASAEEDAQRVFAVEAMSNLPIAWRRALMLFEYERFTPADIAAILDQESAQIERWIEQASDFLDAHLRQAGFAPAGERQAVSGPPMEQRDLALG